jgi:hypothetical protein
MAAPERPPRPIRQRSHRALLASPDNLEARVVPAIVAAVPTPAAVAPAILIQPAFQVHNTVLTPDSGSFSPIGFTPQQIRAAYGINSVAFGAIAGDGSGQTIAIVDAYDDPNLINSSAPNFRSSDLAEFDRQFNLPDPPSFTKLSQDGSTTGLPATDPSGAGNPSGNWEVEEALDVEWAHAIAPKASLILVECNSNSESDLFSGVVTAAGLSGVATVSLSWGDNESTGETSWDRYFQTPKGHQGVTFVASAGDWGSPGVYPAFSPNVVAVGGTTLTLNLDGSYQGETAWSSSGGGVSSVEKEPAYQQGVQNTGFRTIPDVAFNGDPSTGVAVYDSYNDPGAGPWHTTGGTSLSAPAWAALIAIADQGRVAEGGTTLDGGTQTLPALYALAAADFHDITGGGNGGSSAGPGYDQVTGLGTPRADLLVPDLADSSLPDQLVVTAQPSGSVTAGSSFELTVAIENAGGAVVTGATETVTITLAKHPGGATLHGTLTATLENGIATFSGLTIDQAGAGYSLQVGASGFKSVTSAGFDVRPAAPAHLVISTPPPPSVTAGSGFGLAILVEDSFGNTETAFDGTVSLALANNPGATTLGGRLTTTALGGVAGFSGLTIDQSGNGYTISVTSAGLPAALSSVLDVTPAAPAQLVVSSGPPGSVFAGSGFGLTVLVEDAFGNLVTSFDGGVTVSLAGGPHGAGLGGLSSLAAVDGVATFSGLTLTQAGDGYSLEATSGNLTPATTGPITVTTAAPAQLVVRAQPPETVTAGIGFGLSVAVEDAYGNLATTYGGEVTIGLSNRSGGTLGGTLTTTANQGLAEFSVLTLDQVATADTIAVTSAGLIGASTNAITVTPAAPAQLVITVQPPATATAGTGFGLSVTIEDAFGNVETTDAGPVTISLAADSGGATLGGTLAAMASQGVASFSGLTIDQAGAGYTLAADSAGLPSVTSDSITVAPAASAQLEITVQPPGTITAGAGFGLVVTLEDVFGNAVKTFDGSVGLALIGGDGATLAGELTTLASGGLASFSGLTLEKAGSGYVLEAHSDGLTVVTSTAITVAPGAATQLVIAAQPPAQVIAGQPLSFAVTAEDQFGNLATGFEGSVTAALTSTSGGGPLAGRLTQSAVDGLARFSGLTVDRAGPGDSLQVTSDGLSAATTASFAVSPAPADRLVVTVQPPATMTAGVGFGLVVAAEDPFSNIDPSFGGAVTLGLPAGQAVGGSFAGPMTVAAIDGVARFSGLTLTRAGAGYALDVSGGGLAAARTSAFTVSPAAPSQLVVTIQPPGSVVPKQPFGFTVAAEDPFGNVATGFNGTITAALATNPNHNKLGGTLTVRATAGIATFTNATLKKTGRGYALTMTTNGLPGATARAFKVSRGLTALREKIRFPGHFRLAPTGPGPQHS